jgi:hypothetical protein
MNEVDKPYCVKLIHKLPRMPGLTFSCAKVIHRDGGIECINTTIDNCFSVWVPHINIGGVVCEKDKMSQSFEELAEAFEKPTSLIPIAGL